MSKRPLTYGCLLLCIWIVIVHMTGGQDELSPSDITDGTILELEGEIQSLEETPENQVFYLKNNSMVQGLVQVYLRKSETKQEFQIGNRVRIRGKAALFRHATNPGQFDEAEYQTLRGIAFCVKNAEILGKDSHTAIVRESLRRLRECVRASLMRIAEEKDAGVVSAMLLGEKSGLAPELKKMYQKGGISHVLAISGLHISLLGMLLYNLLRKAGLSFGQAGIVGFLCMALYGVLTGAGVATVRAVLMFGVYLGAQYLGRTYDLLSGLAFAVICILIDNPRYLFYAGFQLSALAVLGLGTVYPKLKKCFPVKKKWADGLLAGLSVQIMLLPVMAYWFCEISVYGLLLNLVVVPLMPIVLLSGGTGAVLGIVSTALGSLTFAPCHYGLLIFEKLCGLTGRLPAAVIVTGRPELICIILYYVILILWLVSEKRIKVLWKKRFMGILTMVIMLPFLFLHRTERLEITYLDVGQGDAAFWKTSGGLTFFCDGGSSDVSKVGTYRIVPFLKQKGVDTVDYWILTHMDADHINGMEEIMEMMETGMDDISIGHLILPELRERDETYLEIAKRAEKCGIPVIYAKRGDVWTGEDVTFRVLHPGEEQTGLQQNETSLVFSLECGEFTALFTGDVEGEGESQLVESGALAKADVLKVAHHGSGGSTGEIFLNKVQPQVAILSYGEGNSYGHPDIACLTRLKDRETVIFKTAEHGAVEVHTNGNGYRIKTVCTRSKPVLK